MPKPDVAPFVVGSLRFRPLAAPDLPRTLAWRNREDTRHWFTRPDLLTWDQHTAWFEQYLHRDDDVVLLAETMGTEPEPIGQASLYRIDWLQRSAEFGRLLIGEPAVRGKGLGLEMTRALLELAFSTWNLQSVHLEVLAHNTRAMRIYRACGFRTIPSAGELVRMRLARNDWSVSNP